MTTITCDRCGMSVAASALSRLAIQRPGDGDYGPDRDLCGACSADLLAWLLTGPAPPAEGEAGPAPLTAACSR